MEENHKRFLKHLNESQRGVWLAAQWLNSKGYNVKINTSAKADKHENWKSYVDNGDLEISMRIEVKNLGCHFTNREDWPFGSDFIVCAKHAWDNATPKPFVFIYLNGKQTHIACLKPQHTNNWSVGTRKDSRYEAVEQEFYFADLKDVFFTKI